MKRALTMEGDDDSGDDDSGDDDTSPRWATSTRELRARLEQVPLAFVQGASMQDVDNRNNVRERDYVPLDNGHLLDKDGNIRDGPAFGADYIKEMLERQRLLDNDPHYRLAQLIAGATNRTVERVLTEQSVHNRDLYMRQLEAFMNEERKRRMVTTDKKQEQLESLEKMVTDRIAQLTQGNTLRVDQIQNGRLAGELAATGVLPDHPKASSPPASLALLTAVVLQYRAVYRLAEYLRKNDQSNRMDDNNEFLAPNLQTMNEKMGIEPPSFREIIGTIRTAFFTDFDKRMLRHEQCDDFLLTHVWSIIDENKGDNTTMAQTIFRRLVFYLMMRDNVISNRTTLREMAIDKKKPPERTIPNLLGALCLVVPRFALALRNSLQQRRMNTWLPLLKSAGSTVDENQIDTASLMEVATETNASSLDELARYNTRFSIYERQTIDTYIYPENARWSTATTIDTILQPVLASSQDNYNGGVAQHNTVPDVLYAWDAIFNEYVADDTGQAPDEGALQQWLGKLSEDVKKDLDNVSKNVNGSLDELYNHTLKIMKPFHIQRVWRKMNDLATWGARATDKLYLAGVFHYDRYHMALKSTTSASELYDRSRFVFRVAEAAIAFSRRCLGEFAAFGFASLVQSAVLPFQENNAFLKFLYKNPLHSAHSLFLRVAPSSPPLEKGEENKVATNLAKESRLHVTQMVDVIQSTEGILDKVYAFFFTRSAKTMDESVQVGTFAEDLAVMPVLYHLVGHMVQQVPTDILFTSSGGGGGGVGHHHDDAVIVPQLEKYLRQLRDFPMLWPSPALGRADPVLALFEIMYAYGEAIGRQQHQRINREVAELQETLEQARARLRDIIRESAPRDTDRNAYQRFIRDMYVDPPESAMSTLRTGVIQLRPEIVEALDRAVSTIRDHVPTLAGMGLGEITCAPPESGLPGAFARLVAALINEKDLEHPRQYNTMMQHRLNPRLRLDAVRTLHQYRFLPPDRIEHRSLMGGGRATSYTLVPRRP